MSFRPAISRRTRRTLRGVHQLELVSHESLPRAVKLFEQAIALDPEFFDAYIARSDAYRQLFGYFEPPINMLQKVVDSIAEAQELRPDSAEAWSSLGLTYVMAWRWKDAWIALNKAKRRDPTLARTDLGFALYYSGLGEPEKVKQCAGRRRAPRSAQRGNSGLGELGTVNGRRKQGRARVGRQAGCGNTRTSVCCFQAQALELTIAGDYERGVQLAERGAELDGAPPRVDPACPGVWLCGTEGKGAPAAGESCERGYLRMPV